MFHDHHHRSLYKSSTWFFTAFTITFLTLTILNKDWKTSLVEAIALQLLKAVVYYAHERLWNRSNFGQRLKKPAIVMK